MTDTLTITRTVETYGTEPELRHLWSIADGGERIAELWVDMDSGEILQVWTRDDRRGEGLATALYQQATTETDIYHAPESHRTPEGDGWARSVGGESLPCTYGCCDTDTEEY